MKSYTNTIMGGDYLKWKKIRDALSGGPSAIGVHCANVESQFYEMCGILGYDYVWIDGEHSSISNSVISNAIIATNAGGCAAFVRARSNDPVIIKPILEMGPDGIIIPMINSAQEAEKAVAACRYPPRGVRGFGPLRANRYGEIPIETYVNETSDEILKIIQIEHKQGVNNLDEILEVDGIDVVICGPMDLSASVGKLGQLKDPEVVELMKQILRKCKNAGKPCGISIDNIDLAKFWIENGASFVSVGNPYNYFSTYSKIILPQLRETAK